MEEWCLNSGKFSEVSLLKQWMLTIVFPRSIVWALSVKKIAKLKILYNIKIDKILKHW